MGDPYNLQRFLDAQLPIFARVRAELEAGRKTSHWMWFVFPQVRGLGRSPMAEKFAIASRGEAKAYLQHEILGARLRECCRLVLAVEGRTIHQIFGSPDDLKFQSSMTLFALVPDDNDVFVQALQKYFAGKRDAATIAYLAPDPR